MDVKDSLALQGLFNCCEHFFLNLLFLPLDCRQCAKNCFLAKTGERPVPWSQYGPDGDSDTVFICIETPYKEWLDIRPTGFMNTVCMTMEEASA